MIGTPLITKAFDALLGLAVKKPVEYGWSRAQREERVLFLLDKIGLKPGKIEAKFDAVYAYTLVEWGAVKRREEIEFFRREEVQKAFRRLFEGEENADFGWETEGVVELLAGEGSRFDRDPRSQLDEFEAIFHRLALTTRPPGEVLRDRAIAGLRTEIGALQIELQQMRQGQKDAEIIALLQRFAGEETVQDDREVLRSYLEWVRRRSQRLAFSALDPAQKESDQVLLDDVFVNLDAGEMSVMWPDDAQQEGVITSALGHVYHRDQIVIKGDPGSGKSTLLYYLAYRLAGDLLDSENGDLQELRWEIDKRQASRGGEVWSVERAREGGERETRTQHWRGSFAPVLIELRNFVSRPFDPGDPHAFWRYFKQYLEEDVFDAEMTGVLRAAREALYRRAVRGEVIWLLDGIDEVPLDKREAVWRAVGALESGALAGCRWAATSRVLSFDESLLPKKGIAVRTLQPMSPEQIDRFIGKWFDTLRRKGDLTASEAEAFAERLLYAVEHRGNDFREMAANPMLLTIMALVQANYRGILPEQRARLYDACVDTLLWRWQRRKEPESEEMLPAVLAELGVDYKELKRLLGEIGWQAHKGARSREKAADISHYEVLAIAKEHLGNLVKAAVFIEYTEQRAHLLIGRGGQEWDMYTFPHRTLQEFLAAYHLTKQRGFGREMRALAAEPDMWREVLNLAVGTLVFNDDNKERAIDAIDQLLHEESPGGEDKAGWWQVWMSGELCAVVGREAAQKDEVGKRLLPRLRAGLAALLEAGALTVPERHEAANALARLGDERPGTGTAMVDDVRLPAIEWGNVVPIGNYTIGDKTLRPAAIASSYQLAKYPVTVAQFACFVNAEDVDDDGWWAGMPDDEKYRARIVESYWSLSNRPRETVTWYQAVAFCRWLGHRLKMADLVAADEEIDLPHEDEWEVAACYAGNGQTDRRTYPWGGDAITPDHANYNDTGLRETSAVGLFPAGRQPELGLYDLSGNVWEWCRNKYNKPGETAVDKSGETRILRGGSWGNSHDAVRAAYRVSLNPHSRLNRYSGFRLVRRLPSHPDP